MNWTSKTVCRGEGEGEAVATPCPLLLPPKLGGLGQSVDVQVPKFLSKNMLCWTFTDEDFVL